MDFVTTHLSVTAREKKNIRVIVDSATNYAKMMLVQWALKRFDAKARAAAENALLTPSAPRRPRASSRRAPSVREYTSVQTYLSFQTSFHPAFDHHKKKSAAVYK